MEKIITGKVREVFRVDEKSLLIVTTDRISAFDVILANEIPQKGVILNCLSNFWFDYTKDIVQNHLIATSIADMPNGIKEKPEQYTGRTVLVKHLKMLPFEFIVRGYMFGNMWLSYQKDGTFCGQEIEAGYQLAEKLKTPLLTPSAKNHEGHDEYISMAQLKESLGETMVTQIEAICMALYQKCYAYAYERGIIIADTKFEFGIDENGQLCLGDEIFTPDSSRFWSLDQYEIGVSPASYDKQFVRDWLIQNQLNGVTPAPKLPEQVIEATQNLYKACQEKLIPIV